MKRKNQTKATDSGYSKIPIPISTDAAINEISPTKNAFIILNSSFFVNLIIFL